MRYLLLLYGPPVRPETLSSEDRQAVMAVHEDFTRELTAAGGSIEIRQLLDLGGGER